MNFRENFIRTVTMQNPEWLQYDIGFNPAMWAVYKSALEKVVLKHPSVFRGYREGSIDYKNMHFDPNIPDDNFVDDIYGCRWHYPLRYMDGVVVGHPLSDMADFENYKRPASPVPELTEEQWAEEIARVKAAKERGEIVSGGTEHGFLFLRHTYLRGFENAMYDYADPENEGYLRQIYSMIVEHNMKTVNFNIRRGSDYMEFAEDLGTQTGTIVSPDVFRKWVKPAYAALMQPCKRAGMFIGLHSDGRTLDILEDQIEAGVDVVNPQDLCNGIDNLRDRIKGRACIRLDIDRQSVVPYGTPRDVDDLIHEEIEKLGSPMGGLMLLCGIYPPTPPENVDAMATAIEKYRNIHLPGTF